MRICNTSDEFKFVSIPLESDLKVYDEYDYVLVSNKNKDMISSARKVFVGDVNEIIEGIDSFDLILSSDVTEKEILLEIEKDFALNKKNIENLSYQLLEKNIKEKKKTNLKLKNKVSEDRNESLNTKGLEEYVIRLLGVRTIEQLVYETESLRILKFKGIKVSLIYIDAEDGFLCTRNTTRKLNKDFITGDWGSLIRNREKLANILARPVLNHFKVYSEGMSSGDRLYALFESQKEFLENDFFLTMLKKLLFTNFIRVLQSERLLKNSSLLSQAFNQIQNTSLLISSDFVVRVSNRKESVGRKCYEYMFSQNSPCVDCPMLKKSLKPSTSANERNFLLKDHNYVVHSSHIAETQNSFFLHIYETFENSKKRESIKIQKGKLQSLGLVTQALTHELNNPLTGISELAKDMQLDFEDQTAEDFEEIGKAAGRCLKIIEDLKKFASKKIEFERVDLAKVVESSLTLTKVLTRNTRVEVSSEEATWISGSSTLLSQMIFNIIKNSIEAMSGEGSILISVFKDNGFANLTFKDSGPGLPEGMSEVSLFGTQNKAEGTGFGLFLVNEFVKLHSGELSFKNNEDVGAFFHIKIPLN